MLEDICTETAILRVFQSDGSDYSASYTSYTLSKVALSGSLGSDPDMTEKSEMSLYFLDSVSECRNAGGQKVSLPALGYGDFCVLGAGTANEHEMRVFSVKKCARASSALSYVRLKLK